MIALENLSVTAGTFRLNGISLNADKGDYIVVLGPSGAGKTLLLETIAGLREHDSGKIWINGRDMAGIAPEGRGTVLVYQDYSLFPHMTVEENITYGLKMRKVPEPEREERVNALLDMFRISSLKGRYPGSMSGGEQQRVAIARAIAIRPSVLLLDEPFASLDLQTRNECVRAMQDLQETRSVTVIQVSHSFTDAYALADRVLVLIEGSIAQEGRPDDLFQNPASPEVAAFIGMENIISGKVINNSGRSFLSTGQAAIDLPGKHSDGTLMSVAIPAECISISPMHEATSIAGTNTLPVVVQRVTWGRESATILLKGSIALTAVLRRDGDDSSIPPKGTKVMATFWQRDIRILLRE